jgi:hypothetical protein
VRSDRNQAGCPGTHDRQPRARCPQPIDRLARGHCDRIGTVLLDLLSEERIVVTGRERNDRQARRVRVDNGQSAPADRSRGAENRQTLHITSRRNT